MLVDIIRLSWYLKNIKLLVKYKSIKRGDDIYHNNNMHCHALLRQKIVEIINLDSIFDVQKQLFMLLFVFDQRASKQNAFNQRRK